MKQGGQGKGPEMDETRERILVSAQKLFAESGFESVSLRKITAMAEANVAAVNYHFGSKEALIDEVIIQHTLPIMNERMRLLDEAERKFQMGVVPVEVILDAFMRPFLTVIRESGDSRKLFCKFMGRCMSDRGDKVPEQVMRIAQKVMKRVTLLLMNALQDVELELLTWRLHFCFGVMVHTLVNQDTLKVVSKGACGEPDFETTLQRMIDYCKGGLKAGSGGNLANKGGRNDFFF